MNRNEKRSIPHDSPQIGDLLADRYRLDAKLGSGGMGEVYKARDLELDEDVALKLFPPSRDAEQREIFLNEVKLARKVTHPNVCRVHDLGSDGSRDFLTMELISGDDFAGLLHRDGPPNLERGLEISLEICDALQAIHDCGILHRDLKPSNIMLDRQRRARITDFGLASGSESQLAAGTMSYMAPELFRAEPATIASEIYALGLVLYEIFTGHRAFPQKSMISLGHAHKNLHPKPMPEIIPDFPQEIEQLILLCLSKQAGDRPSAVSEIKEILASLLPDDSSQPREPRRPCPHCSFENPVEMQFCGRCGTAVLRRCLNCQSENPPGFAFCGNCAEPLPSDDAARPPTRPASAAFRVPTDTLPLTDTRSFGDDTARRLADNEDPPSTGELDSSWTSSRQRSERRRITVLAMVLESPGDAETQRSAVRLFRRLAETELAKFDGTPIHLLSRKVVAYYGFPRAHEDAAVRAVSTAWALQRKIEEEIPGVRLRGAVHSALEVIDVDELGQFILVGETPEIAEKICDRLPPGNIAVSSACRRLVEPHFALQPSDSLPEYNLPYDLVTAENDEAAKPRRTMIGREEELALARRAWRRARRGNGQAIWISGQPGIGKTRFVEEIAASIRNGDGIVFEHRCNLHRQADALHPILGEWRRRLDLRSASSAQQLTRLRQALHQGGLQEDAIESALPFLASLLSIAHDLPEPELSPRRRRQLIFDTFLDWWMPQDRPTTLIFEDLQWADPTTLDLLGALTERAPMERVLIVFTARSGVQPPWRKLEALQTLRLGRLDEDAVGRLIGRDREIDLPPALIEQIFDRADGIPLYVEEIARMVLDVQPNEDGKIDSFDIPETLQDLLTARLDRLAEARSVAQIGSALGRGFDWRMLRVITKETMDEEVLENYLEDLVDQEIFYQRGRIPEARYRFRHALIQEAAYRSLLRSDRRELHHRIFTSLTEDFRQIVDENPALAAHHAEGAGLLKEAFPYRLQAGRRATERSANREALSEFERALQLLEDLPEGRSRDLQELDLRLSIGRVLMPLYGWAADEVAETYARAKELAEHLEDDAPSDLFRLRRGVWIFELSRGALATALELAESLVEDARRDVEGVSGEAGEIDEDTTEFRNRISGELMEGYRTLGTTLFFLGRFAEACENLEKAIDLYDPERHVHATHLYGLEPGAAAQALLAEALLFLGEKERAKRHLLRAVELAESSEHPFTRAMIYRHAGMIYLFLGERETAAKWAKATLELGREESFPLWVAWGQALRGSSAESLEDGIRDLNQAIPKIRSTGALLGVPFFYCSLAEACHRSGRSGEALTAVAEARAVMEFTGERFLAPRIERLEDELLFGSLG